jgi:membrane protein required for colicin V production
MNIFDIVVAVILIFGFIRGIMKGLFVEVASLIGLIAGVYGAIHFSYFVGDYLQAKVNWNENTIRLVSFAITFAIIVLVILLLGKLLTKLADFAYLGWINKALGGVFGALKLALILSVIIMIFDRFNSFITFVKEEDRAKSVLYEPVRKLAPTLFPNLIKDVNERIDEKTEKESTKMEQQQED